MGHNAYRIVCTTRDRAAWLEARKNYIGASDVPTVLGIRHGSWSSRMALYESKLSPDVDEGSWDANPRALWGLLNEPTIRKEYGRRLDRKTRPVGRLLRSVKWPWLSATLDAWQWDEFGSKTPLEIKCTSAYESDWSQGEVPRYVYVQAQAQLAVIGPQYTSIGVAVLFYGNELQWAADIPRDEGVIAEIVRETHAFYELLQRGTPPRADATAACRSAISRLYPDPVEGRVISLAGGDWQGLDQEAEEIAIRMAGDKDRRQEIRNLIAAEIGEAEVGQLDGGVRYVYGKTKKGRVLRREGVR